MTDEAPRKTVIPARRSRATNVPNVIAPDIAEDDRYYAERHMGSSVRRYQHRDTEDGQLVTQGSVIQRVDAFGRSIVRQGTREYVMVPARAVKSGRRFHWSLFLGLTMFAMVGSWVMLSALGTWWTDWRNYTDYGYPRTYQMNAIVGHNDSPEHPSHFLFMNLNGRAVVVEFPGGDAAKAIDYLGAALFGTNPSYIPVTGRFYDVSGDGKLDMEIDYGGLVQVWLNNGSKFLPPGS